MSDKNVVSVLAVPLIFFLFACAPKTGGDSEKSSSGRGIAVPDSGQLMEFHRVSRRDVPEKVSDWIDERTRLQTSELIDTIEYKDTTYVLVFWGEKPTGGYEVRIREARKGDDGKIDLIIRYSRPAPDAMVTQVITYPLDIAAIAGTNLKFNIIAEGIDRSPPFIIPH